MGLYADLLIEEINRFKITTFTKMKTPRTKVVVAAGLQSTLEMYQ